MKTNELVKVIEGLGLEAVFDSEGVAGKEFKTLSACDKGDEVLMAYTNRADSGRVSEYHLWELDPSKRNKLLDAFIEYAYTPLDEREDD